MLILEVRRIPERVAQILLVYAQEPAVRAQAVETSRITAETQ